MEQLSHVALAALELSIGSLTVLEPVRYGADEQRPRRISFRTRNCLSQCGISLVRHLVVLDEVEFLRLPMAARKSLWELQRALAERDLRFGMKFLCEG